MGTATTSAPAPGGARSRRQRLAVELQRDPGPPDAPGRSPPTRWSSRSLGSSAWLNSRRRPAHRALGPRASRRAPGRAPGWAPSMPQLSAAPNQLRMPMPVVASPAAAGGPAAPRWLPAAGGRHRRAGCARPGRAPPPPAAEELACSSARRWAVTPAPAGQRWDAPAGRRLGPIDPTSHGGVSSPFPGRSTVVTWSRAHRTGVVRSDQRDRQPGGHRPVTRPPLFPGRYFVTRSGAVRPASEPRPSVNETRRIADTGCADHAAHGGPDPLPLLRLNCGLALREQAGTVVGFER